MIGYKIEGIDEVVKDFGNVFQFVDIPEMDAIVERAAQPLVERIKENYISRGHYKTGHLVNSIQSFQRKRKGSTDYWFTYYVGPKYAGKNSLFYGGNVAHLLEYGTAQRYRAGKKGMVIPKRKYGEMLSTGKIDKPTIGVIRLSADQTAESIEGTMAKNIQESILKKAKEKGYV